MTIPALIFLLYVAFGVLTMVGAYMASPKSKLDPLDVLLFLTLWPLFWVLSFRAVLKKR